jgi:hypothetical protein
MIREEVGKVERCLGISQERSLGGWEGGGK